MKFTQGHYPEITSGRQEGETILTNDLIFRLLLARAQESQLTAEQPSIEKCWNLPRKISYIQNKGEATECIAIESNPIPAR